MQFFEAVDEPKYSFEIVFLEYRFKITVYRTIVNYYVDVYDVRNQKMLCAGKSVLHGVDFFRYININAEFIYVNKYQKDPASVESFLEGGFCLEYPIQ